MSVTHDENSAAEGPRPEPGRAVDYDAFQLEGPAALLTPSFALAALASGLGIPPDAVGAVTPLQPGRLSLEIERRFSRRLTTPRDVPARLPRGRALLRLGRESDEQLEDQPLALHLSLVSGAMPGPSDLIEALAGALDMAGEDLGLMLEGHDFARASAPLAVARRLAAPLDLNTPGGAALRVEVAAKKR